MVALAGLFHDKSTEPLPPEAFSPPGAAGSGTLIPPLQVTLAEPDAPELSVAVAVSTWTPAVRSAVDVTSDPPVPSAPSMLLDHRMLDKPRRPSSGS